MKYAFIAMLAVYLVTFGCNPKSEEEHSTPQENAEHASVEKAPAAPAPPANVQLTHETKGTEHAAPEAGPTNQWNTTGAKETPVAVEAAPAVEPAKPEATEAKVEEDPDNQWKAIAQSAATTVLALMNDENQASSKEEAAPKATVAEEVVEAAVTPEDAKADTKTAVVLPCGKKMVQNGPAGHPPCIKHGAPVAKQPAAPTEETELSESMEKMVHATNNMVAVTRQLVIATQQMLSASREVAVEAIDSGKDALAASKPVVENAINEEEIMETVKEVIAATKEAYEATTEALSNAIEAKETTPAPVATPQQ